MMFTGLSYKASGNKEKAIEHLTKAMDLGFTNSLLYYELANLYATQNDTDKAIKNTQSRYS